MTFQVATVTESPEGPLCLSCSVPQCNILRHTVLRYSLYRKTACSALTQCAAGCCKSLKFALTCVSSLLLYLSTKCKISPVRVAARCQAWVCGRSPAEIVGSNPTGGMDVCCQVERSLRRVDHFSRAALPSVACLNVIAKPR